MTVKDRAGHSTKISLAKGVRLLDGLSEKNIEVESICGGGGVCGCCRIKILGGDLASENAEELSAHSILSDQELSEGNRLACQLNLESDMEIELPNK